MKIDFSRLELEKTGMEPSVSGSSKQKHLNAAEVNAGGVFTEIGTNALDNLHAYSKKSRTPADKLAKAEFSNEKINRNYMAVMANTMSGKDFKELVEKGYSPGQMQPKDAVNSLDRMKVKLAQAGVNVAGYTDTVSSKQAAEITGSQTMANKILDGREYSIPADEDIRTGLYESDLPATDENVEDIRKAFEIASELKPLNESAQIYMVENEMEPTIQNVYEAGFSTGNAESSGHATYFYEGTGYLSEAAVKGSETDGEDFLRQIDEIITEAGFKPDENSRKNAEFLIEKGIPLTKETLRLYSDLQKVDIRPRLSEMMQAIADGKRPADAYLIRDYKNIKSERQLKETELMMTHEANRKLISSDFRIDTKELETEVESLKKDEKAVWDLLDETVLAASEIKAAPAELIGRIEFFDIRSERDILTLSDIRNEGVSLKNRYETMQATYEAVGTEVRADLGDSIKKAFVNVDSLIGETGLAVDDENRRAVRILGYNSMEINEENISRVKAADRKINDMIDLMTPKNVLRLIRENINPLRVNVDELNEKLNSYAVQDEEDAEKFAQYLVKMRNQNEITSEESASYIGIYRLIDKLNRTDGAAIGSLLNQNAELSVKNLLSAIRSTRRGHMDFVVDSDFGGIQTVEDETVLKIDTQISTAFSDEYYEEEAKKFADAAKAEERIFALLSRADIEPSADNVNAAAELFSANGSFFKELLSENGNGKNERLKHSMERVFETMDDPDEFSDAYDEMVDEEIIAAFEGEKLDIRALQTTNRVTAVQKTLADSENYQVPIEINGEITSINLQIRHGENHGNVDIYFESESLGMISAVFTLTAEMTNGTVACKTSAGYSWVDSHKNELLNAMSFDSRTVTMDVIRSEGRIDDRPVNAKDGEKLETAVLYKTAKAFIGGFIYEDQQ